MSVDYRVELTVGAHSWTINRGDPPSIPEVLDGLRVGWQMPRSSVWPTMPEPVSASFSLLAVDAAALADIDITTPVYLAVYAGVVDPDLNEFPSVVLAGRVSQLDGAPVTYPDPSTGDDVHGWQLDVKVADYTADLVEYDVAGSFPLQGVSCRGWINAMFDLAEVPIPDWADGGFGAQQLVLENGKVEGQTLRDAVDGFLKNYADGGTWIAPESNPANHNRYSAQGWRRGVIRSNLSGETLDPAEPYRVEWISRRNISNITPNTLPAAFAFTRVVGGVMAFGPVLTPPDETVVIGGVTLDVLDASVVIDAGFLDADARWSRTKYAEPNRVIVTNNDPYPASNVQEWRKAIARNRYTDQAPIAARITDSRLVNEFNAQFVADMYLGETAADSTLWAASGFTWYASQDPDWPVLPAFFPDAPNWFGHSLPIVITGLPTSQNPTAAPWVVGVIESVDWTFSGGEFSIAFNLTPRVPRPANNGGALTWSDLLDANLVRWNVGNAPRLDPAFDWIQYRLVRTALLD